MPGSDRLVIVGAGGHAKVVVELFRAARPDLTILGFTDADATPREVLGLPVLGGDHDLARLGAEGATAAFVALGDNQLRQRKAGELEAMGYDLPSVVSPAASVSPTARIGRGVAVMAGAVINADSEIGDFAIINTGAVVDHDCSICAGAHVAPGCAVSGTVTVGERTLLGVGASVVPGAVIGADALVAAGACVTSDIPARVLAAGVPARVIRPLGDS